MNKLNILLDTDIGPDCDDVAALAMLNLYQDAGLCRILGIGHCTSNPFGAGTIDAINLYYGHPDIPIGSCAQTGFLTDDACMKYNRYITQNLENRFRDTQPGPAVALYRSLLAQQPDSSVDFIAIGPLNNLSDLLESSPDEYSDLNGVDLVRKKVRRLVSMAGIFPSKSEKVVKRAEEELGMPICQVAEFNVVCDAEAAQNVAAKWPGPRVFLGFEAGLVETCGPLQQTVPEGNPVRLAYKLYTQDGDRFSWDLMTVQYAVDPSCGHYALSEPGIVSFDHEGRTIWSPSAEGTDRFIELASSDEAIVNDINQLLQKG